MTVMGEVLIMVLSPEPTVVPGTVVVTGLVTPGMPGSELPLPLPPPPVVGEVLPPVPEEVEGSPPRPTTGLYVPLPE